MGCADVTPFTSKVAIKLDDERNTTLRLVFKFVEFAHPPNLTFCAIVIQHFYPKLKEKAFLRPFTISLQSGRYLIEPFIERETKRKHSKLTLFPVIYHLTVIKLGIEGADIDNVAATLTSTVPAESASQQKQIPLTPPYPPAPQQLIPSDPPLQQPQPSLEQPSTSNHQPQQAPTIASTSNNQQAPTIASTSNNQPQASVPFFLSPVSASRKQPENPAPPPQPSASTDIPQLPTSSFKPLSYASKPPNAAIPTANSSKRKIINLPNTVSQSLKKNQKLRKAIDIIKIPSVNRSSALELPLKKFLTKPYLQLPDPITEDDTAPTVASINPDEGTASLTFNTNEESADLFDSQSPSEPILETLASSEVFETQAEPIVDTLAQSQLETEVESEPIAQAPDQDNESSSSSQYHDASMLSPPPASLQIVSQESDSSFKLSGPTTEAMIEIMSVEGLLISHDEEENSITIQHDSLLDGMLGESIMVIPDEAEEEALLNSPLW